MNSRMSLTGTPKPPGGRKKTFLFGIAALAGHQPHGGLHHLSQEGMPTYLHGPSAGTLPMRLGALTNVTPPPMTDEHPNLNFENTADEQAFLAMYPDESRRAEAIRQLAVLLVNYETQVGDNIATIGFFPEGPQIEFVGDVSSTPTTQTTTPALLPLPTRPGRTQLSEHCAPRWPPRRA